jgi:hypothetical protein
MLLITLGIGGLMMGLACSGSAILDAPNREGLGRGLSMLGLFGVLPAGLLIFAGAFVEKRLRLRAAILGLNALLLLIGIPVLIGGVAADPGTMTLPAVIVSATICYGVPMFAMLVAAWFYWSRGSDKEEQERQAAAQASLVGLIAARGRIGLYELGQELDVSPDLLKAWIYAAVADGSLDCAINWKSGEITSAAMLHAANDACPSCGAVDLKVLGQGVRQCSHCDTERLGR